MVIIEWTIKRRTHGVLTPDPKSYRKNKRNDNDMGYFRYRYPRLSCLFPLPGVFPPKKNPDRRLILKEKRNLLETLTLETSPAMDKVSSERERSSRRSHGNRDSSRDYHRDRDRERDSSKEHHRERDREHHRHPGKHRSKEEDYSPSDRESRRERSSSQARDSVEREMSVERHHHSSSKKRKDHEEERERESKKPRASEEINGNYREEREDGRRDERRDRKEARRFSDRRDTDERRDSKYVKDDGLKETEKVATNGEHQSGSKVDVSIFLVSFFSSRKKCNFILSIDCHYATKTLVLSLYLSQFSLY
jgi:hypothetical protein